MDEPDKLVSIVKTGEPIYILGEPTVEYDEGGFFDPERRGAMDDDDMFSLEGPDEDGAVSIVNLNGDGLIRYLGPADQVAEVLSQWLGSIDHGERTF